MQTTEGGDAIRFYFSFRSPYAWFASERIEDELGDLGVPIDYRPVYPTEGLFPNDPTNHRAKSKHLMQDVVRLAREQGLTVTFPRQTDTDWALPHAAFLVAQERGCGRPFLIETYRKRFSEGEDVGDPAVIGDAARRAGLDPEELLAAAADPSLRQGVEGAWKRGIEEDDLFGVPTFIFQGKIYWGQDRMRFVRSAVMRKRAG